VSTICVGAGAHAADLATIYARRWPYSELRCVEEVDFSPRRTDHLLVGINDPVTRYAVRYRWSFVRSAEPLVDPSVDRGLGIHIGLGSVVAPRVLMLTDVILGEHVHVNYGTMMTRAAVGDFTTIGPGVVICGDVKIGQRCLIGAGAVIKNLVTIGNDVTIGAGAVVVSDVRTGLTVKGVPAR
jgi:acetyltransferase-like isoleucine patch superfamily enzyme